MNTSVITMQTCMTVWWVFSGLEPIPLHCVIISLQRDGGQHLRQAFLLSVFGVWVFFWLVGWLGFSWVFLLFFLFFGENEVGRLTILVELVLVLTKISENTSISSRIMLLL